MSRLRALRFRWLVRGAWSVLQSRMFVHDPTVYQDLPDSRTPTFTNAGLKDLSCAEALKT